MPISGHAWCKGQNMKGTSIIGFTLVMCLIVICMVKEGRLQLKLSLKQTMKIVSLLEISYEQLLKLFDCENKICKIPGDGSF